MNNYKRTAYGELIPGDRTFQLWRDAQELIAKASATKKIPESYDDITFDRKRRASGSAIHHEVYDIHPDPLRVLVCIRETDGSKYGVRTLSKTYYIIKRHGKGVSVTPAKKAIAAKAAKSAGCEIGCAISMLEGKKKLYLPRACPDGIAYKKLAIGDDGRLYSVYDGSPWIIGQERREKALKDHNGGLYVYESIEDAKHAPFPPESALKDSTKAIVKCRVGGNYCRYDKKLAFSRVTPVNIEILIEN